jgi:hypothetical protein
MLGRFASFLVAGVAAGLPACTASAPARGDARPVVQGGVASEYANYEAARAAFTRSQGPLTATLSDASWIRLEGDREKAEEKHRDYFTGLTEIEVLVETNHFARPTEEDYLLEDSAGARLTARPISYKGDTTKGFGPKHVAQFNLTFPHTMSKDVRWLRLTRQGPEGGSVEWSFPECAPGQGPLGK